TRLHPNRPCPEPRRHTDSGDSGCDRGQPEAGRESRRGTGPAVQFVTWPFAFIRSQAGSENLTLLLNSFPAKASCKLPKTMCNNSFPAKSGAEPSPLSDFADLGPETGVGTPGESQGQGTRSGLPPHQGRALTLFLCEL